MARGFRTARDARRTDVRLFRGVGSLTAVAGVVLTIMALTDDAIVGPKWLLAFSGVAVVLLGLILAALGTLIAAIDDDG
jgi:hypothetical protein